MEETQATVSLEEMIQSLPSHHRSIEQWATSISRQAWPGAQVRVTRHGNQRTTFIVEPPDSDFAGFCVANDQSVVEVAHLIDAHAKTGRTAHALGVGESNDDAQLRNVIDQARHDWHLAGRKTSLTEAVIAALRSDYVITPILSTPQEQR